MCLLTLTLPNATPDYDGLHTAAINNPDGFGFAVHTGDDLLVVRSMEAEWIIDQYAQARASYHDRPSIFHLRLATHGTVDTTNCHPFYTDKHKRTVLAHNGVLPVDLPKGETRSDTRWFAEEYFPRHVSMSQLNSRSARRRLRKTIGSGNKIALLTTEADSNNEWRIINESAGHWNHGTWYSNDSYKYRYMTYRSLAAFTSTTVDDDEGWPEEIGSAYDSDVYDVCYNCSSNLTEDEISIFGYCETCGSCVMCAEPSGYCMCYHAPESDVPSTDRYSYDASFYREVLSR
jgi:predicted glutamine amidotransferase